MTSDRLLQPWESGELERPRHVADLFASLARRLEPAAVLDPYAVTPTIAVAASDAVADAEVVAISPATPAIELGSRLQPRVDWRSGDPWDLLPSIKQGFDLIISSPPVGMAPPSRLVGLRDSKLLPEPRSWRHDVAQLVLCMAADRLTRDGRLVFLLGQGALPRSFGPALTFLEDRGLGMEAAISVRDGLVPVARAETQAVVFSHGRFSQLFVGRVGPSSAVDPVIENLLQKREGSEIELGVLLDRNDYRGWPNLKADRDLELSMEDGARLGSLGEVAFNIKGLRLSRGETGPALENAFYLPEVGIGPARLQIDWSYTEAASRSVVAIDLDPEQADAAFIAQWLNSPHGVMARKSLATGTVPRISRQDLKNLRVPLPAVDRQKESVELRRDVSGLRAELQSLDERLSGALSGSALEGVAQELKSLREGDDVEAWANRLPFPVASILKRYLADAEDRGKYERLLFFFEAFSALLATTLLSSARADERAWLDARARLIDHESGRPPLLRRADFGSWIQVGRTLAKHFRRVLGNDGEDAGVAGEIARRERFGPADRRFYLTTVDKNVWSLLDQARESRNRHKGHGGEMSRSQLNSRLRELEQLLGDLHELTNRAFDGVQLIQPGEAAYDGGVYRYRRARQLTGTTPIFYETEVSSLLPLNADGLYFVDHADLVESAIELLPLIRLDSSPETEETACYFYNAVDESGECRFVSYHFAAEAELPLSDAALDGLISDLQVQP